MKKSLLFITASLAALGIAAPAMAANLDPPAPVYKAPIAVPVSPFYDWSGFYVGANAGGGWSDNCWDSQPSWRTNCHGANGATVGGQLGYRWQVSNWVFGIEGQGNWAEFSGSHTDLNLSNTIDHSRVNSFGLVTGQFGYAWNNVLLYGKGGLALLDMHYDRSDLDNQNRRGADVGEGRLTAGAGLEIGFTPNWSVGVEYDHIFRGSGKDSGLAVDLSSTERTRINQDIDMVMVRLNYKFGGPSAARY